MTFHILLKGFTYLFFLLAGASLGFGRFDRVGGLGVPELLNILLYKHNN